MLDLTSFPESKTKYLFNELVNLIADGVLQPGDRLPAERQLSDQYQVSRAMVREVLSALETLGAIKTKRGGGSYVADLHETSNTGLQLVFSLTGYDTEIESIVDFRKMLELEAVRLTIKNCKDSRRLRLLFDASLVNMERNIENEYIEGCIKCDREFHEIIVSETNNRLLQVSNQASIISFEKKTDAGFVSFSNSATKEDWIIMHQMHKKMADAIVEGNLELACQLMNEHIELVRYQLVYCSK
ncbi:MAG: FadR/GntR family transcriptional regulator [Acetivibrionales bacterium]